MKRIDEDDFDIKYRKLFLDLQRSNFRTQTNTSNQTNTWWEILTETEDDFFILLNFRKWKYRYNNFKWWKQWTWYRKEKWYRNKWCFKYYLYYRKNSKNFFNF